MKQTLSVYVSKELCKKIDSRRGDIPRSRYILRILEDAHVKLQNHSRLMKSDDHVEEM